MWYRCHKGFTLLELMIVVALMGIVAAIAIPNVMAWKKGITVEELRQHNQSARATTSERQTGSTIEEQKLSNGKICLVVRDGMRVVQQVTCACQ